MITAEQLTQALVFVEEHGALQEKARLLYLLTGEKPPAHVVQPLLAKQNPDGGFPSRPRGESPSSVDNTVTALWQLDELGMLDIPPAGKAVEFLIKAQQPDGRWDENPDIPGHDLPPWIQPGELATQLYLTAYAAYWLILSRRIADPTGRDSVTQATDILTRNQQENGQIPSYLHANWIAASVYIQLNRQTQANRILEYLMSRPFSQWEASQIAWALDCLGRTGLPFDHPFVRGGLSALVEAMEPQGAWSSEEGSAYAASATISALKALKTFGKLPDF